MYLKPIFFSFFLLLYFITDVPVNKTVKFRYLYSSSYTYLHILFVYVLSLKFSKMKKFILLLILFEVKSQNIFKLRLPKEVHEYRDLEKESRYYEFSKILNYFMNKIFSFFIVFVQQLKLTIQSIFINLILF